MTLRHIRKPFRSEKEVRALDGSDMLLPVAAGNVPNPGRQSLPPNRNPPLPVPVTQTQWEQLLGLLANGSPVDDAIFVVGVDPVATEGMLRADSAKWKQWREAIIAGERRHWSTEVLHGICTAIAEGTPINKACAQYEKNRLTFMRLVRRDPVLKAMYDEARAIAAELESDTLREFADDDSNDVLDDGKGGFRGNTAAVGRSKLKVDTRLRLMSSYNRERFADKPAPGQGQTNIQVNINHADRLESARARLRMHPAKAGATAETQAVDAEFSETEGDEWINS